MAVCSYVHQYMMHRFIVTTSQCKAGLSACTCACCQVTSSRRKDRRAACICSLPAGSSSTSYVQQYTCCLHASMIRITYPAPCCTHTTAQYVQCTTTLLWMLHACMHANKYVRSMAPFGWNYKPAEKHCWLIFCERKILF
jgi:hypothetical protein